MISSHPQVMGILNVTPDSFADGGQFTEGRKVNIEAVLQAAAAMADEGVDWFDRGGESTRPGADAVSEQEEIDRVAPVVTALSARFDIPISVDTSSAALISMAEGCGARMINDVRALQREGALEAFVQTGLQVCLMHMQRQPTDMQDKPEYVNVVEDVSGFLSDRMKQVVSAGVEVDRICLDPGFGFGKTLAHNLDLLRGISRIKALGAPILVGFSRKSMIGTITGRSVEHRLAGTIALNLLALEQGASILRVHDVAAAVDTVKIWNAVQVQQR